MSKTISISANSIQRLIKDIREIKFNPLTEHGIFYQHSDDDILLGQALIIGPKNTPYEHGFYLFEIQYPPDYPHKPPTFKYCTNDGKVRFNPNLYICGKVCLSILNTWRGEKWTACQSISTVLLVLCTILNNKPLLNEPGISESHPDFSKYNQIITYKNYDTAICHIFENEHLKTKFNCFFPNMKEYFINNYIDITDNIKKNYIQNSIISTNIYNMSVYIDYQNILKRLENIYLSLKN